MLSTLVQKMSLPGREGSGDKGLNAGGGGKGEKGRGKEKKEREKEKLRERVRKIERENEKLKANRCVEECINAAVAGYQKIPSDDKACHDDDDMARVDFFIDFVLLLLFTSKYFVTTLCA